jgi:serine/threonine protein kinase
MDSDETLQPGAVIGGDFVIERKLARGGMGALYVARQRSTGRARALKILQPELLTEARQVERFMQEARIGAAIRSRHIVEVIASGVDRERGAPWLAMELLEGETLSDRVGRGALGAAESVQLFNQLADAVGAAHEAGVVHRDLKPENLFLQHAPSEPHHWSLKVLDFGVSKVVREHRTSATATGQIGTPLWMAPEQCDARGAIRPATDVWALGLIGFYVLTGRHYWRAANEELVNLSAIVRELLVDPIEPASLRARSLHTSIAPTIDPWFARCLERDATARFANARDACHAFVAALHSAAPQALGAEAYAPTVALAAVSATPPSSRPAGPFSSPTVQVAPAPLPQPSTPATSEPATAATGAASSRLTRALWAVAVLCGVVGIAAGSLGIYKRFEFMGAADDAPPPPRPTRPTAGASTNELQVAPASTTVAPLDASDQRTPPAQTTVQAPVEPTATVTAPRPLRSLTRSESLDESCQQASSGAMSYGYYVAGAPDDYGTDQRDARAAGCRSALEFCSAERYGSCPSYRSLLSEGHAPWCCPAPR